MHHYRNTVRLECCKTELIQYQHTGVKRTLLESTKASYNALLAACTENYLSASVVTIQLNIFHSVQRYHSNFSSHFRSRSFLFLAISLLSLENSQSSPCSRHTSGSKMELSKQTKHSFSRRDRGKNHCYKNRVTWHCKPFLTELRRSGSFLV